MKVNTLEYIKLRMMSYFENSAPKIQTFNHFMIMAGYSMLPDQKEIEKRELDELEIIKSSETYYEYDNMEQIDDFVLRDYET